MLENPRWALGVVPGWCCGSLFLFFFYSAVRVRHSVSSSHLFFSFQPPSFFSIPSPFLQSQFEFSSRLPILNTFLDPVRPRSAMLKESQGLRRDMEPGQNSQPSSTRTPFRRPVTYYPVLPLGLFRGKNLKSWERTGGGLGEDERGKGEG